MVDVDLDDGTARLNPLLHPLGMCLGRVIAGASRVRVHLLDDGQDVSDDRQLRLADAADHLLE